MRRNCPESAHCCANRRPAPAKHVDPDAHPRLRRSSRRYQGDRVQPVRPTRPGIWQRHGQQLTSVNTKIMSHAPLNWSLLVPPACLAELGSAGSETIPASRLDNLYRRALSTASRSYSQPPPPA